MDVRQESFDGTAEGYFIRKANSAMLSERSQQRKSVRSQYAQEVGN